MLVSQMPGGADEDELVPYELFVAEVVAVLTIAAVLILQYGLSVLESYTRRRRHLQQITNAAFRETTLLGVAALILFLIQYWSQIDEVVLHQLEIMHICVWVIAILYISWVLILTFFSMRTGRKWASWEDRYKAGGEDYKQLVQQNIARYMKIQSHLPQSRARCVPKEGSHVQQPGRINLAGMAWLVFRHPQLSSHYFNQLNIRRRFVRKYSLPHDFPFWLYLNECKQHVFLKLVELPIILWAAVIYTVSLDIYLRSNWSWYEQNFDSAVMIVIMSATGMLLSAAVFFKMRAVLWVILHRDYQLQGTTQDVLSPVEPNDAASQINRGTSFQNVEEENLRRTLTMAAARTDRQRILKDRRLFWFGLPIMLVHLLQLALFAQTAAIAIYVVAFSEVTGSLASVLWATISIVVSLLVNILFLSSIVPSYVLAIHVSELVDVKLLATAVMRHEKLRRRRQVMEMAVNALSTRAVNTPDPSKMDKFRKVIFSHQMQVAVSFAILVDFFLISLVTSAYVSQLGRTLLLAFDIAILVFITAELLIRIFMTGLKKYFAVSMSWWFAWNVIDVAVVAAAIAATVVSAVHGFGAATPTSNRGAALYLAPLLALRLWRGTFVMTASPPGMTGSDQPVSQIPRAESFSSIGQFGSFRCTAGLEFSETELTESKACVSAVAESSSPHESQALAVAEGEADIQPGDSIPRLTAHFLFSHSSSASHIDAATHQEDR